MNLFLDRNLGEQYKSSSQKIRIMSEHWVGKNVFCPCCGNSHIRNLKNNQPVADMQCDNCGEVFELKSKRGKIGNKITDGAYDTMIARITSDTNPDLFVMSYSEELAITDLMFIPKFFFTANIIEKRKPLSSTAKRAGWVGCNILYSSIPEQGKISIIKDGIFEDKDKIVDTYSKIINLSTDNLDSRGWLMDILNCINDIKSSVFSLQDVYSYVELLQKLHLNNHNIEAKIRQQLQILRNKGFIEFLGNGHYRKLT